MGKEELQPHDGTSGWMRAALAGEVVEMATSAPLAAEAMCTEQVNNPTATMWTHPRENSVQLLLLEL